MLIRVASIPAGHPYVTHIQPLLDPPYLVLPELYHEPGRWWPPIRLTPAWLVENSGEYDLVHTHFGYESMSLDAVRTAVDALRSLGKPLVLTVHDLQNPHLADDELHLAQVAVLVEAAAQIVTLTAGAAAEIAARWGRDAVVIPHPHILPLDALVPAATAGDRVGVHLGDLRARVHLDPLAADLRDLAARVPLTIDVQANAWATAPASTRSLVDSLGADELLVHDRWPDDELYAALRRTRVQVLPYRRGTHSGWLEMCLDLGVAVAAPTVGYLLQQHPEDPLVAGYAADRPGSLVEAVDTLLRAAPDRSGWPAYRSAQRDQIASAYAEVYRAALAGRR